jgi:hypothetical protein
MSGMRRGQFRQRQGAAGVPARGVDAIAAGEQLAHEFQADAAVAAGNEYALHVRSPRELCCAAAFQFRLPRTIGRL